MKSLVYITIILTNLAFGQSETNQLSESEIVNYVNLINRLKSENNLVKISYPTMSGCGGNVDGYYLNKKLELIDSKYNAELGYTARRYYIDQGDFLKIDVEMHIAEWAKYEKNYPPDKYEWDPSKMTYTEASYSIIVNTHKFYNKKSEDTTVGNKVDQSLLDRLISCGQQMKLELQGVTEQVDSLKFVKDMPYICHDKINDRNSLTVGCGDDLFWKVVRFKDNVIELLIDKLNDTTTTESVVPNFGYYYTTADIAYSALNEIIHEIPTFDLLGVSFDNEGCGYCSYWQHLNKSYENRKEFRIAVKRWYHKNKNELVWVESNLFATCDCPSQHPNGGHYRLKNKD